MFESYRGLVKSELDCFESMCISNYDREEEIRKSFKREDYEIAYPTELMIFLSYLLNKKMYRIFDYTTKSSDIKFAFKDKHWKEYLGVNFYDRACHLKENGRVAEQNHKWWDMGVVPGVFGVKYIFWEEINDSNYK